jgi:XTP/dITP diphosphohydrolase
LFESFIFTCRSICGGGLIGDTMKKEILIATNNQGKAEEIEEIFQGTDLQPRFMFEFQEKLGNLEIQENAKSFEGNALIKAIIVGDVVGMITLADDSGLCIDALGGRPGVYSARYSEEGTDEANNAKVLMEMRGIPMKQRGCYYNCTVAIYDPETKFVETVKGEWEGRIGLEPRGSWSFGYAPLFLSKEFGYLKTNAELRREEVTSINHRGKSFRLAIEVLQKQLLR